MHQLVRDCGDAVSRGLIALSIFFIVFSVMERVFSARKAKKAWRATVLDLQYAFLGMFYPPFIYFILAAIFGFLAVHIDGAPADSHISIGSFMAQLAILLFGRDCLIYIRHRIFHLPALWAFHSIHHSSEELNWTSTVRFHPAENVLEAGLEVLLFLAAGVVGCYPAAISVATFTVGVYNFFIHSNLPWTLGPLRYVFVSPVQHRWHHSDKPEAVDKNFAAMFSCLDLFFGTFYMPKDSMPETTGLSAEERSAHPRTFTKQLLYPFRRRSHANSTLPTPATEQSACCPIAPEGTSRSRNWSG